MEQPWTTTLNVDLPESGISEIIHSWRLPGSSEENLDHRSTMCGKCSMCCQPSCFLCPYIVSDVMCNNSIIRPQSWLTVITIVWCKNCNLYLARTTQRGCHDITLNHFVEVTIVTCSNHSFVMGEHRQCLR